MTDWTALRHVLELRNRNLNDDARTSRKASTTTAAGSEPGPGGVGPGAVIRAGCADRGRGGQGKHRLGLCYGGPDTRNGLAVALAEQPVRLSGKFLSPADNALVPSLILHVSRQPGSGGDTAHALGELPKGGMPVTDRLRLDLGSAAENPG